MVRYLHFLISRLQRSIEPDPDSTMSDLSVLNEMDQYLEECLEAEESYTDMNVREEGPTPPKVNRGKSPSRSSSSFNYHSYVSTFTGFFPTFFKFLFKDVTFISNNTY